MMLVDLVNKIEKRPEMYITNVSISYLKVYLDGYLTAADEKEAKEISTELAVFRDWLAKRKSIKTNQSWDQIILFFSSNERSALSEFFKLFSEYKESSE